jgi:hypothetical protein
VREAVIALPGTANAENLCGAIRAKQVGREITPDEALRAGDQVSPAHIPLI